MDNRTGAAITLGMLGAIGATLAAQSSQTAPGGTLSIELLGERPASRVELRGSFGGALRTRRA